MPKLNDLPALRARLKVLENRLNRGALPDAPTTECYVVPTPVVEAVRSSLRRKGLLLVSLCGNRCGRPDHYAHMTRVQHGVWCLRSKAGCTPQSAAALVASIARLRARVSLLETRTVVH